MACLEWLARHFGRPYSQEGVLAGLPLETGQPLTSELFIRAAARLGLKAVWAQRKPSSLPALMLPSVVMLDTTEPCILVARAPGGRKCRIVFPAISPAARDVSTAALDRDATGRVLLLTPDDVEQPTHRRTRKGHWLWSSVFRFWPAWLQIMLSAFLVNLLGLAFPLFAMNVYDRVIPNAAFSTLWALTAGIAIALTFELILRQLRSLVLDQTGRLVDIKVGADLFAHAMAIRMGERRESIGTLANQIREFDSVRDFFTSSSVIAATDLVFIGLGMALLWSIVGPIAAVPMLAVPIVIAATLLIQLPLGRAVRQTQALGAKRHAVLVEALSGIEAIKSLGAEGIMQRRWEQAVAASARASSATRFWSTLALYGTITVQQAIGVAIIGFGVYLVVEGQISMGALIAASMLSARILAPLGGIAQTLARAQQSFAAMRALDRFMTLERESGGAVAGGARVEKGEITLKDVDFTYPGARGKALQGVSIAINPGERVGLIGRIGSGKSTLGRLIAGFYRPDSGVLLVDGVEIARYEPADLRAGVGFVAQETDLLEGTLRDNVTLGARNASEADLAEVCRVTGVDAIASAHPAGLSMPVGERGRALSGGQRQSVVLARMLLRHPKVLFLDEPTSAMDMGSEADLLHRLRGWLKPEQTLLICTHRVSLLELVDRLVVVDHGRIVADGPKDAVLRQLKLSTAAQAVDTRAKGGAQ